LEIGYDLLELGIVQESLFGCYRFFAVQRHVLTFWDSLFACYMARGAIFAL
jgi:hypothetical protein